MLKKAVAQLNIRRENCCGSSNIRENHKIFSRLTFVAYSEYIMMVIHCNAHYYANISL